MVTRNFLFLLVTVNVFLAGCQTIERRKTNTKEGVQISGQNPEEMNGPSEISPTAQPPSPESISPVGIYFGPGVMRAYAHIGVLRALTQSQIPIVAVGGDEWGATVGALYAFSKSANDVEWQMLKFRKELLPAPRFLKKELEPKDAGALSLFMKSIFSDKSLETVQNPFFCSASDGTKSMLLNSGKAWEQVTKCTVLAPTYAPFDYQGIHWTSGVLNPPNWVEYMSRAGAKFIIYVDVLGDGPLLTKSKFANGEMINVILSAIRSMSFQQSRQATMVIKVPLTNDILDFEGRRDMIRAGEKAGVAMIPEIQKAIGMTPK